MKNFINNFVFFLNAMHAIVNNSLPGRIRFDLFKGYFKCKWAILLNKNGGVSLKIGPYTYKSPNARFFKTVFIEVLMKEEYLLKINNPRPFIIDCGSNVGFSVLYFKLKYPDARIIAVEANIDTFKVLSENIKQLSGVTALNCFVSNVSDSSVDFYTKGVGDITASFVSDRGGEVLNKVETISLAKLIGDNKVDILKMDIEGGEFVIFKDTENIAALKNVNNVLLEYHHIFEDGRNLNSLAGFLDVFEKQGFQYNVIANMRQPYIGSFQDIFLKMSRPGMSA